MRASLKSIFRYRSQKDKKSKKSLGFTECASIFATLYKSKVMGIRFTTKKMNTRGVAARRRQMLRVNPNEVIREKTLEESNRSVIAALEAKLKA
jgi:hypothetical protein